MSCKIIFFWSKRNQLIYLIIGRGVLTPLFYEEPLLYCLHPLFTNFVQSPPCLLPCQLQPPPSLLFLWLTGWSRHIWCAILLNYMMDLHMFSLCTLAPEGPWCVFYATRHQVYWALTNNVVFCWYSNLISHTYTHKDTLRHTAHWESSRLTHPYKYLFTPRFMCSRQLSLLPWMNNSQISKNYFLRCLFFSAIIHL